jgi:hypothetical protein
MDATGANLPLKKLQFKIDTAKKEREVAEIRLLAKIVRTGF